MKKPGQFESTIAMGFGVAITCSLFGLIVGDYPLATGMAFFLAVIVTLLCINKENHGKV